MKRTSEIQERIEQLSQLASPLFPSPFLRLAMHDALGPTIVQVASEDDAMYSPKQCSGWLPAVVPGT